MLTIVTQLEAGGAQVAALRVAAGFREKGYRAETWFLYQKRAVFRHEPGVRVVLDRPPRNIGDYLVIFWRLLRMLSKASPTAVVTFTHYANVLGLSAAFFTGVRTRIASHRNPRWTYPRSIRWLDSLLGTVGVYSKIVAVSRTTAVTFSSTPTHYRRRILVVPNGVAPLRAEVAAETVREQYRIPSNDLLVVAVGRLAYQKNYEVLVRALASVRDVHLLIAGEGEMRKDLEGLAASLNVGHKVRFLGEVPRESVAGLLSAGDVFVMPSRFEGLSNALLEALAAGLPVIASDVPAQAEVLEIKDGSPAGVLVSPEDVDGWVSAIQAMTDPQVRATYAARAKDRAEHYSIEAMVQGFADVVASGSRE